MVASGLYRFSAQIAYYIMLVGRTIFGIGAESASVIQLAMVAYWFSGGRELAMALGFVLSMSRLVKEINTIVFPESILGLGKFFGTEFGRANW